MNTSVMNTIGSYTGYAVMLLLASALVAGQTRSNSATDKVRRIENIIADSIDLAQPDDAATADSTIELSN